MMLLASSSWASREHLILLGYGWPRSSHESPLGREPGLSRGLPRWFASTGNVTALLFLQCVMTLALDNLSSFMVKERGLTPGLPTQR